MTEISDPLSAQLNQASAKHRAGDLEGAVALYREILRDTPEQPDALHMLGVIAQQKGNPELSLKLIEAALAKDPENALAWNNRAIVLRLLRHNTEAISSAQNAVALDPALVAAHDMIGMLLLAEGKINEAVKSLHRAYMAEPDKPQYISNYAQGLFTAGDYSGAYHVAKKLAETENEFPAIMLGNVLKSAGRPAEALPYYARAVQSFPDLTELRVNYATTRLLLGDYTEGWKVWETRADLEESFRELPFWDGKEIDQLVLYEDQGLGDILQFARYIPQLRKRANNIALFAPVVLKDLLQTSFPDIRVKRYNVDEAPQAVEKGTARIRMMSLPALLSAPPHTPYSPIAYLSADSAKSLAWETRLQSRRKPRIGIVWGGNPKHLKDHERSVSFAALDGFCRANRGHLISLQKGIQKTNVDFEALDLFDADTLLTDFTETAALISRLDLIISVDTAPLHLAGALGVPAWLLTPFDPDFRWLLGREDSPWYPRLRLFRQEKPGDWSGVISRITKDIERLKEGDRSVLIPKIWRGVPADKNPHALDLGPA